jgi:glycosyltransferase involved in cell wall biosynthesis
MNTAEEGTFDPSRVLAVSWFDHRRTRELCAGLGIEVVFLIAPYRGLRRYLQLTVRTLTLLARRRPAVLLVQNPSLVLSMLALALRWLFGYRLVVDAHNEAVVPFENSQGWVRRVSRWVIRHAELTIVTNVQLARIVEMLGGRAFVLPDAIPSVPPGTARELGAGFNVALIATFAKDEPIGAIFEAVRGADLKLYVTGNQRKLAAQDAARVPENVRFTGFLAEQDYWDLLRGSDAIIDLTLKPNCLVCGAYEALAVGRPVLLSDNAASMELFGDGAAYTDSTPQGIRRGVERLRSEPSRWQAAARAKANELAVRWGEQARGLTRILGSLAAARSR